MNRPLRLAIVGGYPATSLLPKDCIRPRFHQAGQEHPHPSLRALCRVLGPRDDIEVAVFNDTRSVNRTGSVRENGIQFTFTSRWEPMRVSPYHLHYPARKRLQPHLESYNPDVVHGIGTQGQNGLLSVGQKKPSIVTMQGIVSLMEPWTHQPPLKNALEKGIERYVIRKANRIFAQTEFAKKWALSVCPTAQVDVVPSAHHPEFLDVSSTLEEKKLLCIGSLCPWKGSLIVIRAFAQTHHADASLYMIGEGSDKEACLALAQELGVAHRIHFCSHLSHADLRAEMKTARGLVLGSRMDTAPNCIHEGHAAGLPVIGTTAGGIPEMIRDGTDGYLVGVDDVSAMAMRMDTLLDNRLLAQELGLAGRNRVQEVHNPGKIAEIHISMYRELVGLAPK